MRERQDRFEFIAGDIRNVSLDKLVEGVDYVVNVAALVGEHICKKFPEDAQAINEVVRSRTMLAAMPLETTNPKLTLCSRVAGLVPRARRSVRAQRC